MPNQFTSTQRGFTLIEMSIVLVIIGLIVGGILKGQEVIESARQKNMASLFDQIRAAHTTFVDRYRALPGDYRESTTKLHANVAAGNGNGIIGTLATSAAGLNAAAAEGENLQYFNGLIAAGLFGGGQVINVTQAPDFSGRGGTDVSPLPQAPWSSTGLMLIQGNHEGSGTNSDKSAPWLRLSTFTNTTMTTAHAALTIAASFQLDTKIDDGLPWEGRVRTSSLDADCGNSDTNNVYDVTSGTDTRECNLLFAVD